MAIQGKTGLGRLPRFCRNSHYLLQYAHGTCDGQIKAYYAIILVREHSLTAEAKSKQ